MFLAISHFNNCLVPKTIAPSYNTSFDLDILLKLVSCGGLNLSSFLRALETLAVELMEPY